ncbi:Hypothetical predicted protein, partial [Marmota monax]
MYAPMHTQSRPADAILSPATVNVPHLYRDLRGPLTETHTTVPAKQGVPTRHLKVCPQPGGSSHCIHPCTQLKDTTDVCPAPTFFLKVSSSFNTLQQLLPYARSSSLGDKPVGMGDHMVGASRAVHSPAHLDLPYLREQQPWFSQRPLNRKGWGTLANMCL